MACKIILSQDAHRDIDEIAAYIAHELKNPQAAAGFLNEVEDSYRRIADNPRLYSLCNDERLHREGYRKVVIKNYLMLYRADETEKYVYVVRIIYGARDYARLI